MGSSILLIRTIRCLTPAVFTNIACSLVWPPRSNPVSNSPLRAEMTCQKYSALCDRITWKRTISNGINLNFNCGDILSQQANNILSKYFISISCCSKVPTNIAKSAWEAPPIMLGTKLLWPGASKIVKCFLSVSKNARPTSTVLPFSRSSKFVSSAHERYLHNARMQKWTSSKHCYKSLPSKMQFLCITYKWAVLFGN